MGGIQEGDLFPDAIVGLLADEDGMNKRLHEEFLSPIGGRMQSPGLHDLARR